MVVMLFMHVVLNNIYQWQRVVIRIVPKLTPTHTHTFFHGIALIFCCCSLWLSEDRRECVSARLSPFGLVFSRFYVDLKCKFNEGMRWTRTRAHTLTHTNMTEIRIRYLHARACVCAFRYRGIARSAMLITCSIFVWQTNTKQIKEEIKPFSMCFALCYIFHFSSESFVRWLFCSALHKMCVPSVYSCFILHLSLSPFRSALFLSRTARSLSLCSHLCLTLYCTLSIGRSTIPSNRSWMCIKCVFYQRTQAPNNFFSLCSSSKTKQKKITKAKNTHTHTTKIKEENRITSTFWYHIKYDFKVRHHFHFIV